MDGLRLACTPEFVMAKGMWTRYWSCRRENFPGVILTSGKLTSGQEYIDDEDNVWVVGTTINPEAEAGATAEEPMACLHHWRYKSEEPRWGTS